MECRVRERLSELQLSDAPTRTTPQGNETDRHQEGLSESQQSASRLTVSSNTESTAEKCSPRPSPLTLSPSSPQVDPLAGEDKLKLAAAAKGTGVEQGSVAHNNGWRSDIDPKTGHVYYYHVTHQEPMWELPESAHREELASPSPAYWAK